METAVKLVITLVIWLAVAVAMALDPAIGGRARFEHAILTGQQQGCVDDKGSLGRYCYWIAGEGGRVASRAY